MRGIMGYYWVFADILEGTEGERGCFGVKYNLG